jgi:hypothetical protein
MMRIMEILPLRQAASYLSQAVGRPSCSTMDCARVAAQKFIAMPVATLVNADTCCSQQAISVPRVLIVSALSFRKLNLVYPSVTSLVQSALQ